MYGNNFGYNPYNGYGYQQGSVIRVNGENGAKSIRLMPNGSALALDETAPIVWLCQADGAGYVSVSPFKIVPIQSIPAEQVTLESLNERLKKLEDSYEPYTRQNAGAASATAAKSNSPDVAGIQSGSEPTAISERTGSTESDPAAGYRQW